MPEFRRLRSDGSPLNGKQNPVKPNTLNRHATKPTLPLLLGCVLAVVIAAAGVAPLRAQATQSAGANELLSASAATSDTQAPQQTPPAKISGMVWVNTDAGVYHKPGTRWYGKTKHGKYMLEADAIKAGYKPAK